MAVVPVKLKMLPEPAMPMVTPIQQNPMTTIWKNGKGKTYSTIPKVNA
jgi:hypothetical protein